MFGGMRVLGAFVEDSTNGRFVLDLQFFWGSSSGENRSYLNEKESS